MKKALLLVLFTTLAATVWTERPLRIETRGPEVTPPVEGDDPLAIPFGETRSLSTSLITASFTPFVSGANTVCSIVPSTTIVSAP